MIGTLYIVSTPIGNLDDITLRAIKTLQSVDIIVCEDTRVSSKLLQHLGISKKLISYNNYNENDKTLSIINLIEDGNNIALISDAGTPLISDPGYLLVHKARQKNIKVEAIGGVCSPIIALTLSSLPTNRFLFLGFLDKSASKKKDIFKKYQDSEATLIFFESPNRILNTLQDMLEVFGDNQEVVVAKELSKLYEEVKKDTLANLIEFYENNKPRGEFVVLCYPMEKTYSIDSLQELISTYLKDNAMESTKNVAKSLSAITNINKNIIYDEIIKYKNQL
ncbi:MAG: 16S rRNA (cytidine(1402)-2'-O)-methyltransferase [Alphaproteobacteria bacterium]|jgi:16S rRNA (cytidine1402-2'-O)-methyltransferase|nr:16S rRNA (cytidine(1402)-2'-O)-methyltransferase [Alphaproteobacteria bacterium]